MRTTVATIEAHSASCYCVLLCLCGCSIVWQDTFHLIVTVIGRGLSDMNVPTFNSFYPVARLPRRQAGRVFFRAFTKFNFGIEIVVKNQSYGLKMPLRK